MVQFESFGMVFYPHSITMALSCIISKTKRDVGRNKQFFTPSAFDALVGGMVWYSRWLPVGAKIVKMYLLVLTEYRNVTDRQMDGLQVMA